MKKKISHYRVRVTDTDSIHLRLVEPRAARHRPAVIFSHGFVTDGAENHGIFVRAADAAAERGFTAVNYDNLGCGYSDGDYSSFCVSEAADHLAKVARWVSKRARCNGRVVLFGQSLGTAVAVQSLDHCRNLVNCLVLWNFSDAIPIRFPKLFGEDIARVDKFCVSHKGFIVSKRLIDDARGFSSVATFCKHQLNAFFLNCGGDSIGDPSFSLQALSSAGPKSKRTILAEANHSFMCQRELEADAIQMSLDWIEAVFE